MRILIGPYGTVTGNKPILDCLVSLLKNTGTGTNVGIFSLGSVYRFYKINRELSEIIEASSSVMDPEPDPAGSEISCRTRIRTEIA